MFYSGNDGYGWMMVASWGLGHWLMFAVMDYIGNRAEKPKEH